MFSPAWADAFLDAVNRDVEYRDVAKGWTNPVALVVEPEAGVTDAVAVQVDLKAGTCVSAAALAPDDVSAPFVLTGDLAAWKDILGGSSDPIMAVARGKVKLTRGSLTTLMLHAKAARALLACAQAVETCWP